MFEWISQNGTEYKTNVTPYTHHDRTYWTGHTADIGRFLTGLWKEFKSRCKTKPDCALHTAQQVTLLHKRPATCIPPFPPIQSQQNG